jgi:hypothetical protein
MADVRPDRIWVDDAESGNVLNVNTSGAVDVNWDNCPINEESIRAIASEESKKVLELKTKQLRDELDYESPIRIMRRKVQDWLK